MNARRRTSMAAVLAVPLLLPAVAVAEGEHDQPPDLSGIELHRTDYRDRVEALSATLPKVTAENVLDEASRQGEAGCEVPMPQPDEGGPTPYTKSFCFEDGSGSPEDHDATARDWYPQGITTIADSTPDEQLGGKQPVLVSWYDHWTDGTDTPEDNEGDDAVPKGLRISFIDPDTGKYEHALLAFPYLRDADDAPTYEALTNPQTGGTPKSIHGGGLVWYGDRLFVPDTANGIRVFDLTQIFDLKAAGDNGDTTEVGEIGLHDGTYYGHGFRYVIPQVERWQLPSDIAKGPCTTEGRPSFSHISLDRTTEPDSLISGEYCDAGNADAGRALRWPLNVTGDTWKPDDGYWLATNHVQGAVPVDGRWYGSETGYTDKGFSRLWGAEAATSGQLTEDEVVHVPTGGEDLSYWPSRDELWTLTEYPGDSKGSRYVYAVPREALG